MERLHRHGRNLYHLLLNVEDTCGQNRVLPIPREDMAEYIKIRQSVTNISRELLGLDGKGQVARDAKGKPIKIPKDVWLNKSIFNTLLAHLTDQRLSYADPSDWGVEAEEDDGTSEEVAEHDDRDGSESFEIDELEDWEHEEPTDSCPCADQNSQAAGMNSVALLTTNQSTPSEDMSSYLQTVGGQSIELESSGDHASIVSKLMAPCIQKTENLPGMLARTNQIHALCNLRGA